MFVPEYARSYIDELDREYRQEDIFHIARGQLAAEKALLSRANRVLFCDSELIVTKIWSLYKYGSCHPWIEEQIREYPYELYLLCDVDIPWQPDPQREHPHLRTYFFSWFRRELDAGQRPYQIISGSGQERVSRAIATVDHYLKQIS